MSGCKPDSRKVADAVLHYYCASVNAFVLDEFWKCKIASQVYVASKFLK